MAKKTAAPRRNKPTIDPFDLAIITGKPLPATFGKFRAARRVEFPFEPGLLWGMPSLADVWRDYYGREMTEADAAKIRGRAPEVERAVAVLRGEAPR